MSENFINERKRESNMDKKWIKIGKTESRRYYNWIYNYIECQL